MPEQNKIILYTTEDGNVSVDVYFEDETFWLTQKSMAELFDCTADNVSLHLKNIYSETNLTRVQTAEKFSVVRREGERDVRREVTFYNLDAIIAVGYRVNSKSATRFRQWATQTLKEYIIKGFVLNDDMMKTVGLLAGTTLMNCWSASKKSVQVNEGFTKKLRISMRNAATIMILIVRPQRISSKQYKTSFCLQLQAIPLRNWWQPVQTPTRSIWG